MQFVPSLLLLLLLFVNYSMAANPIKMVYFKKQNLDSCDFFDVEEFNTDSIRYVL